MPWLTRAECTGGVYEHRNQQLFAIHDSPETPYAEPEYIDDNSVI